MNLLPLPVQAPTWAPVWATLSGRLGLLLALGLLLPAALWARPAQGPEKVTLDLRSTGLEAVLHYVRPDADLELPPALAAGSGDGGRMRLKVRGVPRERFLRVLLRAAGLEAEEVAGTLWIRQAPGNDLRSLTLEDLEGFQRLELGGRDILDAVRRREEARLDPLTRAYQAHRRALRDDSSGRDDLRGGYGWLGVRLARPGQQVAESAPEALREALETWDGWGAFILDVLPEGPAALSGLVEGDVIVKFSGLWVDSNATLIRLVSRAQREREIEIEVLRGGKVRREYVVIGERSRDGSSSSQR